MKRISITLALVLMSLSVAMLYGLFDQATVERDLRAQYLKAGDFSLEGPKGVVSLSDFKGHPVVLYFGYTFCPDVCPVGLAVIRDAIQSDERLGQVKALFVTLDPERDGSERLLDYTNFFHPNIIGLTGTVAQIKSVTSSYGGFFRKVSSDSSKEDSQSYTIDHSAYYYIIDSQGSLMRVLDHNVKANEIAELLIALQ